MYDDRPVRKSDYWDTSFQMVQLPSGTIKKLTGKDITWESGYVEYTGDNYDPTID